MSALDAAALLGPEGRLARALDGYEHRPSQLKLARAVEDAFSRRGYLLAEAGTGTGKTLAYLVPAALSGRKVVVSTATKTLQDQIFFKDIPLLQSRAGLEFEAAYLKGRSNYLCAHRYEAFERDPAFASRDEVRHWPALRDWALSTQSGDRAELDLPESFGTWRLLSTTSETCLGQKCPFYEPCFVTKARRRAESADIVVVNHHLFFADLAIRSRHPDAGVLPKYDAVVFDEAHALEDVATDYFGVQVSSFRFEELANDALAALPKEDPRAGMISATGLLIRGRAESFFRKVQDALWRGRGDAAVRLGPESLVRAEHEAKELNESLAGLSSLTVAEDEPLLGSLCRRAGELAEELDFIRHADSAEHVFWAEARGRGVFLRGAPIEIAREMKKRLYGAVDTAIFTSATLAARGRFDFVVRRLGLDSDETPVETLAVDSPFDFARQAALYLPTHLPDPNEPGFIEAAAEEIIELCALSKGRAFALFTSLRNMEAAHRLARTRLPYQVLLQGERPKSALLEAFKAEPSVLFASASFWEGVDVPGDALSLVVIDRLPFASPGDPLVSARIELLKSRGEEPFGSYQVPEAALALRQGFGRLIRTRKDRGVVALLDKRATTRSYGRVFLDSLPNAARLFERKQVAAFFPAR